MPHISEQDKPLAPAAYRIASDDTEQSVATEFKHKKKLQQRKCMIQCCGCVIALLLILVVILLVLILTIFHVKAPVIKMNSITIQHFELENGTLRSGGANITLTADVSVKNNNYASFRFDNTTTVVFYHGARIGEALTQAGQAKKRRTLKMNLTIDVFPNKLLAVPGLSSDVSSGSLNFSSYTRISGRIKVIKTYNKYVVVNCTMTVDVTGQAIRDQNCNRHVEL